MNLAELDIVILCGGKGTRMRPVLGDLPKALAPINKKPLLERLLEYLQQQGAKRVILCTGVGADQIEAWRQDYRTDIEIATSVSPEPRGERAALHLARPLFRSPFIMVMNGDTLLRGDLSLLPPKAHASFCVGGIASGVRILPDVDLGIDLTPMMFDASWILSFIDCGTPEGYARAQREWSA